MFFSSANKAHCSNAAAECKQTLLIFIGNLLFLFVCCTDEPIIQTRWIQELNWKNPILGRRRIFYQLLPFGKKLNINFFLLIILICRWTFNIFAKGYKKDINVDDLYKTLNDHKSGRVGDLLEQ